MIDWSHRPGEDVRPFTERAGKAANEPVKEDDAEDAETIGRCFGFVLGGVPDECKKLIRCEVRIERSQMTDREEVKAELKLYALEMRHKSAAGEDTLDAAHLWKSGR